MADPIAAKLSGLNKAGVLNIAKELGVRVDSRTSAKKAIERIVGSIASERSRGAAIVNTEGLYRAVDPAKVAAAAASREQQQISRIVKAINGVGGEARRRSGGPTVAQLKADAKAAGVKGTSRLKKAQLLDMRAAGKFSAAGLIAGPIVAASIAYDSTKSAALAAGGDQSAANSDAMKAAAGAGAGVAAVTAGIIGGIKGAAKIAPTVGRVASKAVLPLTAAMAAYEVGRGAVEGYKTGGLKGAVAGGAMGGADFLTFGAASHMANRQSSSASRLSNDRISAITADRTKKQQQRLAVNAASRNLKNAKSASGQTGQTGSTGQVQAHTRRQGTKLVQIDARSMSVAEMKARAR